MVGISRKKLFFITIFFILPNIIDCLLWPRHSVLQVTAAGSIPLVLTHKRKSFFDYGVQMNYNMPYSLKEFYNVPIWPRVRRKRRTILYNDNIKNNSILLNNGYEYNDNNNNHLNFNNIKLFETLSDFTAGEFYGIIEEYLKDFGFDETCLLKTICEHSKHPFKNNINNNDIENENIIEEIISLILSPSVHNGFAEDESDYKYIYEEAEKNGLNGNNCDKLYPDCEKTILDLISTVKFME
ncbi:CAR1 transcription factor-like [Condylostylus longicornis]|uniref:CAR1 transcription factor-like n=1 Tax=Condylostylus longicornis TaxID=2530218 RepID=UPI00244DE26A|nr:CAR1 transcription factor-like [Condylostylus longicornis]